MSEQTTTAVAEEIPFVEWAKARTFGAPKSDAKEVTPAGAEDKTGQAAPGDDKAAAQAAPEEIKAAEPDDEKDDDETTAEALKNPGAKKRLGGWARKADKAEKAAEVLRKENETLKAQLAAKPAEAAPVKTEPAKKDAPAQAVATPKPKPEDFQSVDDYTDALVDWKVEQKLTAKEQTQEQKAKQDAEKARTHEVMQGWDKQVRALATETAYADFGDVVLKGGVQYPDFIAQALYEDENGPKVAYQLAKEPALLKELANLTPAKAIAKIGRLSAKFDPTVETKTEPVTTQEKPTPKPSAAPTPIRPSSTPTNTSVKAAEEMSTAEWLQQRNQRVGRR